MITSIYHERSDVMSRIVYTLLVTAAATLFTSAAFAQGTKSALKQHIHQEGRFEALMPADTKSTKSIKGIKTKRNAYEAEGNHNGADFTIVVEEISAVELTGDKKTKTTAAFIDFTFKRLKREFGNDVTKEIIQQHGMQGAHFYVRYLDKDSGQKFDITKRVLFDGKRTYNATHIATSNTDSLNLRTKFLDSVKSTITRR